MFGSITNHITKGKSRKQDVLVIRPSGLQPLPTFHFLTTEGHARTVTVPLDGGNLDVVPARHQFCALRIA